MLSNCGGYFTIYIYIYTINHVVHLKLIQYMWDLPGPGLKPMSPALAGGFLTTAPPGKSCTFVLKEKVNRSLIYTDNLLRQI